MGCECCKELNLKDYERCKMVQGKPYKTYLAPCGTFFERGSNYTPPKKKKKRKKNKK